MTQYRSQSRLSVRGRQGPISPRNGYSAHRPDCPTGRGQIGAGIGIIGHPTRHEPPERPGQRDTIRLPKILIPEDGLRLTLMKKFKVKHGRSID